jgi:hypothetical protein
MEAMIETEHRAVNVHPLTACQFRFSRYPVLLHFVPRVVRSVGLPLPLFGVTGSGRITGNVSNAGKVVIELASLNALSKSLRRNRHSFPNRAAGINFLVASRLMCCGVNLNNSATSSAVSNSSKSKAITPPEI